MTVAYQPCKTEEEEEEVEEEVNRRMPRPFEFGDQGSGAAHETLGAGSVDPFDPVGMRRNLWQRIHLRCCCGQGHPATPCASYSPQP